MWLVVGCLPFDCRRSIRRDPFFGAALRQKHLFVSDAPSLWRQSAAISSIGVNSKLYLLIKASQTTSRLPLIFLLRNMWRSCSGRALPLDQIHDAAALFALLSNYRCVSICRRWNISVQGCYLEILTLLHHNLLQSLTWLKNVAQCCFNFEMFEMWPPRSPTPVCGICCFITAHESVDPLQQSMIKTSRTIFALFEKIKSTHDESPFTLLSFTQKSFH